MINPTMSVSCIEYSIKKYFLDAVGAGLGAPVYFDPNIMQPYIQDKTITKWITVLIDTTPGLFELSETNIRMFICTRDDNEGYELAKVYDSVMSLFTGKHDTIPTDALSIPLYDHSRVKCGGLSIILNSMVPIGGGEAPDGSRYKIIPVKLRYASTL